MKNLFKSSVALLIVAILFSCSAQKNVSEESTNLKKNVENDKEIKLASINYDSLKFVLDSVHYYDQYFFNHGLKGKEKYTKEEQAIIEKVNARHIQNEEIVSNILDTYGWLGPKEVGQHASNALFLVIQHSQLETQVKYLPLLQKAVIDKKADIMEVAMLEDRMAIYQGKKQKYGTQLPPHPITGKRMFWPIEDLEKIDELRKQIGYPPMSESLEFEGVEWNEEKHKAYTKELIDKNLMGFYIGY